MGGPRGLLEALDNEEAFKTPSFIINYYYAQSNWHLNLAFNSNFPLKGNQKLKIKKIGMLKENNITLLHVLIHIYNQILKASLSSLQLLEF